MADELIATVKIFSGTYYPADFLPCDGRLIAITSYQALYSVMGTAFGGDGRSSFGLPNTLGRTVIGSGAGAGLTVRIQGQTGGYESVVLAVSQIPAHTHAATAVSDATSVVTNAQVTTTGGILATTTTGNTSRPESTNIFAWSTISGGGYAETYHSGGAGISDVTMSECLDLASTIDTLDVATSVATTVSIENTGSSLGHENMQPFIVIQYVICVEGVYPPRP